MYLVKTGYVDGNPYAGTTYKEYESLAEATEEARKRFSTVLVKTDTTPSAGDILADFGHH